MTTATSPSTEAPASSPRGQKLWAVLLVLDSFFVIIFGGALAAKVYQHWQAPASVLPARRAVRRAAPAPAPKPAEPAKAPAAPRAAAPKAQQAPRGPVPNPSLLEDTPRHASARLQGSAPAAPAAADDGKVHALPVEFRYKGSARSVEVVGAFIVHGGKRALIHHSDGTWSLKLYLTPNTYHYHFLVNGKRKIADPSNPDSSNGSSTITVGR